MSATPVRRAAEPEARTRQVLLRCAAFAELDAAVLADVVRRSAMLRFARRAALYDQGAAAQWLFVVASGRVRLVRDGQRGRLVTLGYAVPGQLIGDSALGADPVYHESAIAGDSIEAVRIPLRVVSRLAEANGAFALRVLQTVVDRRRRAEQQLAALVSRSVESRLAEFLLEAAESYGIPESRGVLIGVKFTHQEIASVVGATRETVTLALGELKRRGQVVFDHRRIVVREPEQLRGLV